MSAGTVRQDLLSEIETWKAATKREARRADEALRMHEEHTRRANERLAEVEAERDRLKADALPIAFADCEALVSAGLLALAEKEDEKANAARETGEDAYRQFKSLTEAGSVETKAAWSRWTENVVAHDLHRKRAACLREMSLAVLLGQFRTAEINERAVVAAHREAAGFHSGSRGGHARAAKLSPERRKEIAQLAARARWAAKKGE